VGSPEKPSHPSQFALPRGLRGRLVGRVLARANAQLNAIAVARLSLPPSARVLEVGYGPGDAIRRLAEAMPQGAVAGIDPSTVMREQALRRNRAFVDAGRVDLRLGVAAQLPWPDGAFDAVLSVNNILLWRPFDASVAEVRRVLRPGGLLLAGMHEWAARAHAPSGRHALAQVIEDVTGALARAGFGDIGSEVVPLRLGRAFLARGTKPPTES
jgi:SAM-dependent methyltransferase